MAKEQTKYAIRKLVKAYLVFNRGREVTANEMANWINDPDNGFGLKTQVHSRYISRMFSHSRNNNGSILYDVKVIDSHPKKYRLD